LTGGAGNASQATANVGGATGIFNPSARQRKAPEKNNRKERLQSAKNAVQSDPAE
jgi:hypothetical protein